MRISLALTLACCFVAALSCNKNDPGTTDPDAASDESLLGIDAGAQPRQKKGDPVPVGCIQDPSDPDCADVLGAEQSNGELIFTGDTCRTNLCHGHGDCELDADGFVACACDDNATGETCKNRKK
jgi:hypothetical protein